ncbi:hypothetical protein LTR08_007595 [Meristemomyces frigidus]|nr:hypothetical protein LTR08_007595 [Meristemomyces frigidus]
MPHRPAALPYSEPNISTILTFASFLLLLNSINYVLDRTLYCGLVGQILLGTAWGAPGADWLPRAAQETITQLGYLGLILVVYEGGLSTNLPTLKANLPLSASVAVTGISAPIALSFALQPLLPHTSPVQVFAAGAALCSTSLGTTFTVLATSGLSDSRLGVVLTSAAMLDDVAGLVMVQVISALGRGSHFDAVEVVRPVCVSVAFAVLLPLLGLCVVKPVVRRYRRDANAAGRSPEGSRLRDLLARAEFAVLFHAAVLLALVAGASYAGTSDLFAAYLAGVSISWWDGYLAELGSERQRLAVVPQRPSSPANSAAQSTLEPRLAVSENAQETTGTEDVSRSTGVAVYKRYYAPAVRAILKPFFFASIGFSIPVTKMFSGGVVWRGVVYAALMAVGKLLCGLCLVRIEGLPLLKIGCWPFFRTHAAESSAAEKTAPSATDAGIAPRDDEIIQPTAAADRENEAPAPRTSSATQANSSSRKGAAPPKPRSLYPATMLGSAMMARGEIGFLIASVAESSGVYSSGSGETSSELYLVVTWAVLLCTIVGPVAVGLLVKRVRRLQALERSESTGRADPLGVWGVVGSL